MESKQILSKLIRELTVQEAAASDPHDWEKSLVGITNIQTSDSSSVKLICEATATLDSAESRDGNLIKKQISSRTVTYELSKTGDGLLSLRISNTKLGS